MSESLIVMHHNALTKATLTRVKNVIYVNDKPLIADAVEIEPIFKNDVDPELMILGFNETKILIYDNISKKFMWKKCERGSIVCVDTAHSLRSFKTSEAELLRLARSML